MLYLAKRPAALTIPTKTQSGPDEVMHVRGKADAPVTLEEFADFQCPPCGVLAGVIKQLEHDYQPRLRVIFRHFPLANHRHARAAALAAEAAGVQGRFWEMHDLLYREQPVWSKAADVSVLFNSYAGMLGLDVERFKKDMESDKAKARVASDQQRAATIGVKNTPTIFLNDRALEPTALNLPTLRATIDTAVKEATTPK
jgi:protein-disulfide isomerase